MIILASNSPRRKQLFALAGWNFISMPADIDEQPLPAEDPGDYVLRLAESKAETVLANPTAPLHQFDLILAADTTVVVDNEILGKPVDPFDAERMLLRLRQRTHQVFTGAAIRAVHTQALHLLLIRTDVHMRNYTAAEIAAYIASGDPLDKAGAYAIQHRGFHPVAHVDGCWGNVVGLPLCQLNRLLAELGHQPDRAAQLTCPGPAQDPCPLSQYFAQPETIGPNE